MELNEKQLKDLAGLGLVNQENSNENNSVNADISIKTPEMFWPKDINNTSNTPATVQTPSTSNTTPSNNNSINNQKKQVMDNCNNLKTITKQLTIVAGSVAGTYSLKQTFGNEYKKVKGLYIIPSSLGGLTNADIKVGYDNGTKTIIDPTMLEHWLASTSVEIKKRFYMEDMDIPGGYLNASVVTGGTLTSDLNLQLIAICEKG